MSTIRLVGNLTIYGIMLARNHWNSLGIFQTWIQGLDKKACQQTIFKSASNISLEVRCRHMGVVQVWGVRMI